ncbi:MAG: outer membrane protein [Limisphaerales bacterium]
MNVRSRRNKISIVFAASLVSAWSRAADLGSNSGTGAYSTGFYQSAGAAVAFIQTMTFRGPAVPGIGLQFHAGPKFDLRLGYNLARNTAVEVQTGFAYNGARFANSFMPSIAEDVWTAPVIANGIYKRSFDDHWQACGGVGVGAIFSSLGFNSSGETTDSTDSTFGYHAMVGIKYLFKDRWEAGLGYDFLGSLDHHWSQGQGLTAGPTYMHSVVLTLTYKF